MTTTNLLDTNGVAEMLGIKPETVRWYSKKKILPAPDRYFGRSPVWNAETVREWDEARKTVIRVDDPSPSSP